MGDWRVKPSAVRPAHAEPVAFVQKRLCLGCGRQRTKEQWAPKKPRCSDCMERYSKRRASR